MRLALVVASALCVVACRSATDPSAAIKPFPCDHAQPSEGQCPATWLCGLEDRCFDPAVGKAQRCARDAGAAAACPGGWRCGVEGTCFDPTRGSEQKCLRDAGLEDACPGLWRCGLDDKCFDPSLTGRPSACAGDTECVDGWRCNQRSRVCQQRGKPGPYACDVDEQCEAADRCDVVSHECRPENDRVVAAKVDGVRMRLMSPLSGYGVPTQFALGGDQPEVLPQLPPGLNRQTDVHARLAAFIVDGGLVTWAVSREYELIDGGRVNVVPLDVRPIDEAAVTSLTVAHDLVLWTLADGGLRRLNPVTHVESSLGSGAYRSVTSCQTADDTFQQDRLAVVERTDGVIEQLDRTTLVPLHDLMSMPPSPPLSLDMVAARDRAVLCADATVVATADAGWVASYKPGSGGFFRLGPQSLLPGGATPRRLLTSSLPSSTNAVLGIEWQYDGGWGVSVVPSRVLMLPSGASEAQHGFTCPGRQRPLSLTVSDALVTQGDLNIVARCPAAPGVAAATWDVVIRSDMGRVTGPDAKAELSRNLDDEAIWRFGAREESSGVWHAHMGREGRLWLDDQRIASTSSPANRRALVLDRIPDTFIYLTQVRTAGDLVAISNDHLFSFSPGVGVTSQSGRLSQAGFALLESVPDTSFVVAKNGVLYTGNVPAIGNDRPILVATLPAGIEFRAPARAKLWQQSLFVSSADTLWAADVAELLRDPAAPPVRFSALLSPSPGLPIRSFALSGSDGGAPDITVATDTGVFHATPTGPSRWQARQLDLSNLGGSPVAVKSTGPGSRLFMSTGQVFAVPSRVQLAGALPDARPLLDVGELCGDTLALSTNGLHALTAVDAGTWTLLPSDGTFSSGDYAGAKLFVAGPRVMLVSSEGKTAVVATLDGGCPR